MAHQASPILNSSQAIDSSVSATTLAAFLSAKGMVVAEMRSMANRYRVLVKDAETMQHRGSVDVIYRGNNQISSIEARIGNDAGIQVELRNVFIGRPADVVVGLSTGVELVEPRQSEALNEHMSRIVERVSSAASGVGIRMTDIRVLTPYHLRVFLSSSRGRGSLDFYFDKKGRLTSCGEHTIPSDDYNAIARVIAEGGV